MKIEKPKEGNWLTSYIYSKIYVENENFHCIVTGPSGRGKSTVGLKIAEMFDPSFDVNRDVFYSAKGVIIRAAEMVDQFNSCKTKKERMEKVRGKVLLIDEGGRAVDNTQWFKEEARYVKHLLQMARYLGFILIICTPVAKHFLKSGGELMHVELQCVKKNVKKKINYVKPFILKSSGTEKYDHRHPKYQGTKVRMIQLKIPSRKLIQEYEALSHRKKGEEIQDMAQKLAPEIGGKDVDVINDKVIAQLYSNGMSYKKIGKAVNKPWQTVRNAIYRVQGRD